MTKNPKWAYSELVLALEIYMNFRPNPPGKNSREVNTLSNLLRLKALSEGLKLNNVFRNNNGVAMKLQNFRRFDNMFKGKGLRAGGALEKVIWEKYQNLEKLKKDSQEIRNTIELKMKAICAR
jgi:5-methylcytosine-specific restriction protein A|tara:strand:- start:3587 stop:3955 length:369 start_codon:yes stop_codon:yes gene_type:complete